jgi:hypothetical protein
MTVRAHNPKVVSSNLPPATMGAYEENPLSALLILELRKFLMLTSKVSLLPRH